VLEVIRNIRCREYRRKNALPETVAELTCHKLNNDTEEELEIRYSSASAEFELGMK
jgi:hypothetical protein